MKMIQSVMNGFNFNMMLFIIHMPSIIWKSSGTTLYQTVAWLGGTLISSLIPFRCYFVRLLDLFDGLVATGMHLESFIKNFIKSDKREEKTIGVSLYK